MNRTKTLLLLVVLVLTWGALGTAQAPALGSVNTVYVWPMRHALDQYLAEQVLGEGLFQVVVDPKLADAILTERIDATFLKAIDEVFAVPGEPSESAAAADSSTSGGSVEEGLRSQRPTNRPMGRPSGTVFLVHAASRRVLWSTFINQKDFAPKNLHQQARDVVGRLKKEIRPGG